MSSDGSFYITSRDVSARGIAGGKGQRWSPAWSPFIVHGYRPHTLTALECLGSVWSWHNETINIWTHVFGTMLFVCLAFVQYTSRPTSEPGKRRLRNGADAQDQQADGDIVVCFFCACLALCLACSVAFHVFDCTDKFYNKVLAFDVTGIFGIIFCCVGTAVFHVTSHPALQTVQGWHLLTFSSLIFIGWWLSIRGVLAKGQVRGLVPYTSIVITFSFWLVGIQHLILKGEEREAHRLLYFWGSEYVAWAFTFLPFASSFPETVLLGRNNGNSRCSPFMDYAFNSHNIFHVAVVMSAYFHYHNLVIARAELYAPAGVS